MRTTALMAATLFLVMACKTPPTVEAGLDAGIIGKLDDRTKTGPCFKTVRGWGVFTVVGGKKNSKDSHDPRCELTNIGAKIVKGKRYNFEATYKIGSADNTTIAQILNFRKGNSDKHKPTVFITVRKSGKGWGIFDQKKKLAVIAKNRKFKLRIATYTKGKSIFSDIYINDDKKSTKPHSKATHGELRFGNYHHGKGKAVIYAKNVRRK